MLALASLLVLQPAWGQSAPPTGGGSGETPFAPSQTSRSMSAAGDLKGRIVRQVRVIGNVQVPTAVILNDIRTKAGQPFDPDTVVDRLKELESELGIDGILFELNFGAAIPAETMMRSLKLICHDVMPKFQ